MERLCCDLESREGEICLNIELSPPPIVVGMVGDGDLCNPFLCVSLLSPPISSVSFISVFS